MGKLTSLLLAAALAGCASSTPISQGGMAEIVFARSDTIRIRWNPQRTNERDMRSKAIAFCGGRDVYALDTSTDTAGSGPVQVETWRCEAFSGTGAGM
jgi:hypothetical protein